ncbi:MAG: low molecular weight protein arginine phosphatase [Chthoniobacterales bacterium]
MKSILFVCTGNTCRSPLAEGLFRNMLRFDQEVMISSAGVHASRGLPASANTLAILAEEGIDLSLFRSQPVTPHLIKQATHIFAMTHRHLRELATLYPDAQKKIFLLNEGTTQEDILDPIGGSIETYRHCFSSIQRALENILMLINKNII